MLDGRMFEQWQKLVAFTKPCRHDMHEPDEQGVKVAIVGDHLDNACGEHIDEKAIREGYQEYVVVLRRFDEETEKFLECPINLASLIALARQAA